jgi:hypothetical protein
MGKPSDLLLQILTWSYHGALQHYTLQPVQQIHRDQHEPELLRILFVKFRYSKEKEISFVTAAVSYMSILPCTPDANFSDQGYHVDCGQHWHILVARSNHHILGGAHVLALQSVAGYYCLDKLYAATHAGRPPARACGCANPHRRPNLCHVTFGPQGTQSRHRRAIGKRNKRHRKPQSRWNQRLEEHSELPCCRAFRNQLLVGVDMAGATHAHESWVGVLHSRIHAAPSIAYHHSSVMVYRMHGMYSPELSLLE